jgi:two-component system OmpR family response regulator
MAGEPLVLIVDDDPHIREVVRFALEKGGFRVAEAGDGRQALIRCAELRPELLILDITMPEMDGTDVCRTIRAGSDIPIIFLSSRDDEIDRIVGLELGGDDYVTKPFSPRELLARVKAVLRRKGAVDRIGGGDSPPSAGEIRHGLLGMDLDRFQARWGDREVALTVTEFGILRTLLGYPGKVFSRDELMTGAYEHDTHVTDRTIDSHVRRIRRKFADAGGDPLETVHGVGYKLGPCRREP